MTELVIGRGKLYIAAWASEVEPDPGTMVFVGNCPEFTLEMAEEVLEHQDYTSGLKSIDEEVTIQVNCNGSFVTDNISSANIQKFFLATESGGEIRVLTALSERYALLFVEDNPKGTNRQYYVWKVKLTPSGALGMIADEYRKMTFNFKALKCDTEHPTSPYATITTVTTTTTSTTTTTTTT